MLNTNKKPLIIYGNGTMASTLASFLESEFDIAAYTMVESLIKSDTFNSKPLYPFESLENLINPTEHEAIVAVGYLKMNEVRETMSQQLMAKGFQLASFIAKDFVFHSGFSIKDNSVILDRVSIHANSKIGRNVFIASGVNIGHDCEIGDNVWINSGVSLGGGCQVGNNTFLGLNACVSHGVKLGRKTFVGANTLVNQSTEEGSVILSPAGEKLPMHSDAFLAMSKGMKNA